MTSQEASVEAAARRHGEPDFLVRRRLAALQLTTTAPRPRMQRFDLRGWPLDRGPLTFHQSDPRLAAGRVPKAKPTTIRIVQVGQTTVAVNLPPALRQQGVIFGDLFEVTATRPTLLAQHLMTTVIKPAEDQLTAGHLARLNAGAVLYLPRGVRLEQPVEVELMVDATVDAPLHSHLLVVAGEDSAVQVVEHLRTVGNHATTVTRLVEIIAEAGSHVSYAALDELGAGTTVAFKRRARLARDAQLEWALALMNGGATAGDVGADLAGAGAAAIARAIAITSGHQRVGINNRVTNRGRQTSGRIDQRGVLLGHSRLVLNGIGQIVHGSHGSQADQQNRILMMAATAAGEANPILLIDENDVVAGHAASVGPVDPQQLNYLLSRGIPRVQAERLVVRGFLSPVLTAIPLPAVREQMIALLERRLADGQVI